MIMGVAKILYQKRPTEMHTVHIIKIRRRKPPLSIYSNFNGINKQEAQRAAIAYLRANKQCHQNISNSSEVREQKMILTMFKGQ